MFFIALLIVAFLSFDILGHGIETHRRYHLAIALVALPALLLVPGILVAVLTTRGKFRPLAGHRQKRFPAPPDPWRGTGSSGSSIFWGPPWWWARPFHYFFTAKLDTEGTPFALDLRRGLFQVPLGLLLYASLLVKPEPIILVVMFVGVTGAALLLWVIFGAVRQGAP